MDNKMKEILFPPQLIDLEKQRLEEENKEATDSEIFQFLINVYGGVNVANYLNWYAERMSEPRS